MDQNYILLLYFEFHIVHFQQEEYSGAPVQCLIPGTNQWALIGVSSWRIACGPTGVERPRMYDKIASNAAWIRETISAI